MNLFRIVIKNLTKRALSTTLTITSIVLGVSMVIAIMVVQQETEKSFNQTSVGYDLILSAKGSQLQATLNTLYHLETSVGIIPYSLYETAKNDPRIEKVFPFYVGDSYSGFRVVGTSIDFIEQAEPRRGNPFQMANGRNFERPMEAVLGSEVARRLNHKIGDQLVITHGLTEVAPGAEAHEHDDVPVTVVGILTPSGSANDRVIFTDLYTTHALHDPHLHLDDHETHDHDTHGNEHEHDNQSHNHNDHDHHHESAQVIEQQVDLKELDALLVKMVNPAAAVQLAGMLNFPTPANPILARNMMRDPFFQYKEQIMAVVPAMQINNLMSIVGNAEQVLRLVAWFVVIVALFGVLIAIYNTMEERKRDLAVMRALGARRSTIFSIILLESAIICGIGAIIGLLGGHIIVSVASEHLAEVAGIIITSFNVSSDQIILLFATVIAGILVGLVPALKAYRTDAVQNLGAGK